MWRSGPGILCLHALLVAGAAAADPPRPVAGPDRTCGEVPCEEVPSPYYDSILYRELGPRLRDIEAASNRVRVDVIGQSAGGRDLYLATIAAPETHGRLGRYRALRNLMIRDPEAAQARIEEFDDFKVPVLIHGSIHGDEYAGTDATIRLIETLAFGADGVDPSEIDAILRNLIVLINVVPNPDGRVLGQRGNAGGFDLNRDFITQSQPETRAAVSVIAGWNPLILLDLHGFSSPMLIEPTTAPHNPNYEFDLYLKWAFRQAEAMEAEVLSRTGLPVEIPFRDFPDSWDDWGPVYTPMYAMYHGTFAHTLETPLQDETGVTAHFWAVWGALRFAAEHRSGMIHDQIEMFRRGFLDLNQVPIPDDLLAESPFDQFNELTVIDFPAAHVIPRDAPDQINPHAARRLVDFLLDNDVQVEQAQQAFRLDDRTFPRGTYLVRMSQPKRGLANTILWDGPDISSNPGLPLYDISAWDHTRLWGVTRIIAEDDLTAATARITRADPVRGAVHGSPDAAAYVFRPSSNLAVQAANRLVAAGHKVLRAAAPFTASGETFGVGSFILEGGTGASRAASMHLANSLGVDVVVMDGVPPDGIPMRVQRVAAAADEGVLFALRELGFDVDLLSRDDLDAGILDTGGYDVLVNTATLWRRLSPAGQASVRAFFAAGGDYIGIGLLGTRFAADASFLDVQVVSPAPFANGIIDVDYDPDDAVAAGYASSGVAFVSSPVWFAGLPEGTHVSASIGEGPFFLAGFWRHWPTSGAAGRPVVVHASRGASRVTLMGLDPTFRAHPSLTYRLLANAIYLGLE